MDKDLKQFMLGMGALAETLRMFNASLLKKRLFPR